jgi:hypothetical protein
MKSKNIRRVVMVLNSIQPPYPEVRFSRCVLFLCTHRRRQHAYELENYRQDFTYFHISVEDEDATDLFSHFEQAINFISAAHEAGESVLVHWFAFMLVPPSSPVSNALIVMFAICVTALPASLEAQQVRR